MARATSKYHGVNQLRVIGGVNSESLDSGKNVYTNLLEIPLFETSSIEVAEICKISENSYRYVQIAFAEELKMICEDLRLDFKSVQEACNTKWNTTILMQERNRRNMSSQRHISSIVFIATQHIAKSICESLMVNIVNG